MSHFETTIINFQLNTYFISAHRTRTFVGFLTNDNLCFHHSSKTNFICLCDSLKDN